MRRFLHDLAVLAAISAAGGYALMRAQRPPRLHLLHAPVVVDRPATALEDALHVLRTARTVASSSIGYSGIVPDAVVAWLTVLKHPHARDTYLELLRTGTPAGQIYALAGIRTVDPPLYQDLAERYRRDRTPISAMAGCIGFEMAAADLVAELDRGMWIGDFMNARRSLYVGDLPWP